MVDSFRSTGITFVFHRFFLLIIGVKDGARVTDDVMVSLQVLDAMEWRGRAMASPPRALQLIQMLFRMRFLSTVKECSLKY